MISKPGQTGPWSNLEVLLRKPPPSLVFLTVTGALLSGWMTFEGLFARLFGAVPHGESLLSLWSMMLRRGESGTHILLSSVTSSSFAWPLLTLGLAWMGALIALWLRLGWAYQAAKVIGVLSCLTLGLGSVLALLALIALSTLRKQNWLPPPEVTDGH